MAIFLKIAFIIFAIIGSQQIITEIMIYTHLKPRGRVMLSIFLIAQDFNWMALSLREIIWIECGHRSSYWFIAVCAVGLIIAVINSAVEIDFAKPLWQHKIHLKPR